MLGVFQFTEDYRQWLGIAFIASASLVIMGWIIEIGVFLTNFGKNILFKKNLIKSLYCLTEEEKKISGITFVFRANQFSSH